MTMGEGSDGKEAGGSGKDSVEDGQVPEGDEPLEDKEEAPGPGTGGPRDSNQVGDVRDVDIDTPNRNVRRLNMHKQPSAAQLALRAELAYDVLGASVPLEASWGGR